MFQSLLIMKVDSDIVLLHKGQWVQNWPTEYRAVNLTQIYSLFLRIRRVYRSVKNLLATLPSHIP